MGIQEYDLSKASNPRALVSPIGSINIPVQGGYRRNTGDIANYLFHQKSRYSLYSKISVPMIEKIYETVSIIRAIHDGIEQTITSLDFNIVSKDAENPAPEFHIRNVKEFFDNPNRNADTIQDIIGFLVKDLLKFDTAIIEKIMNFFGEFQGEIYPRYGAEFYPVIDQHGIVNGYIQTFEQNQMKNIYFKPDDIIYMSMFRTTKNPVGLPKMNAIYPEIATFVFANSYISDRFDKSQIPPGLLAIESLSGITGPTETKRTHTSMEEAAEQGMLQQKITTLEGVKANWIDLSGAEKSDLMIRLLLNTCKQIFAAYGVSSVGLAQTGDVNRATAIVEESISKSKSIRPIISLIERYFNQEIVWKHFYKDVQFKLGDLEELDPKTKLEIFAKMKELNSITDDEFRKEFGYKPLTAEDRKLLNPYQEQMEQNKDDMSNSKDEKDSSNELRTQEGTNKLYNAFINDYQQIEKNLVYDLIKAFYGDGKTNNAIRKASNGLYGKFKNTIERMKIENKDDETLKYFTDSIENKVKEHILNERNNIRTKRWQPDPKEKRDFGRRIEKMMRYYYKDNLHNLALVVNGDG